jgi:hypothetical protein
MKFKVELKEFKEIEVVLPYFTRDFAHTYKVFSEKEAVVVFYTNYGSGSINVVSSLQAITSPQCTEEEFEALKAETIAKLQAL